MSAGYILVQADSSPSPFQSAKSEQPISEKWSNQLSMITISRLVTAIGNFSIQYNFQAISVCLIVMSVEQCTLTPEKCMDGKQAQWVMGTATATVFAGAMLGQLTMGYVGDILDRNKAMTLTLSIASLAGVCSAALPRGSPTSVYIIIIICRFVLGAGLGGVYPLSAAKAAEDSPVEQSLPSEGNSEDSNEIKDETGDSPTVERTISDISSAILSMNAIKAGSRRSAMAFFWQVPGSMTPWALAYGFSFLSLSVDTQWRLLLGLGSIPAALVVTLSIVEMNFVHRKSSIGNTARESIMITERTAKSDKDERLAAIFHSAFRDRVMWFKVLYTGGSWFLYDVCFYGVGLFGGEIVASISPQGSDSISSASSLRSTSLKQVFALSLGLPSCAIAILLLKPLGTKLLQTLGFLFVAFSFTLLAAVYEQFLKSHPSVLYGIYCMLLFSLTGGPMVTTFVLPTETFPKEIRATFGGIAAALGKLGAFVGAYLFGPLASATSYPFVMAMCAVVALAGALLSHLCIGAEDAITAPRETTPTPEKSSVSDCTMSLMHSQCPPTTSSLPPIVVPTENLSLQVGRSRSSSHYRTISVADVEMAAEPHGETD